MINTDIRSCWEKIRPGLEAIKRKCSPDWRVEDVYAKCVNGKWSLFTADGCDGFLICWTWNSAYLIKKILQIECAYHAGGIDPFEVFEPQILELARNNGCAVVEFQSPRSGFKRKGWQEVDVTYRMEVPHV